ncbi:MAG: GMP synthase subunit A [Methanomicrobiales archaeon]|nr:GMP synthase subunit A [Methanomicrobiales archaeon]
MQPLYVVNNYGQFNHLILRALRDLEIPARMIPNVTPPQTVAQECRGMILGGGPAIERAGLCAQYLNLGLPVLGICLGLQVIATARGGTVRQGKAGGYGLVEVEITSKSELLEGYPDHIRVWASHADEVGDVPKGFTVLAHSNICQVEAMASSADRLFGIQWHPEVSHTENGSLVFKNFHTLCQS